MEFRFVDYSPEFRQAWDSFVASNPHAWTGHLSAVIDLEELLGHRSRAQLAFDENGKVVAVCPLFIAERREARVVRFRSLFTGSALRGGPLLQADLAARTRARFFRCWTRSLIEMARREGVDDVRVSFPHFFGEKRNMDFYEYFPLRDYGFRELGGHTLLLPLAAGPEALLRDFDPGARRHVKRASAAGACFVSITERQQWLDCHELNTSTFEAEGAEPYPREFLARAWDRLVVPGHADVYGIEHQGRLVTVIVSAGTAYSRYLWLIFNQRPRPLPGATELLFWHVARTACERGLQHLELGSLEFDDARQRGISDFKRKFGALVRPSFEGMLVINELKHAGAGLLQVLARRARRAPLVPSLSES